MSDSRFTAAQASIVFLRIPDLSAMPVAQRAELKSRLETAVADGGSILREDDRIVLDAPDGMAVVVLANAGGALDLANRSLSAAGKIPLAIGINHGPVRVVHDGAAGAIVVGDGIAVAQAAAQSASPGGILASRSFRDALRSAAPGRARYLAPAGTVTDRQDRSHELYRADASESAKLRRRHFVAGALGAAAILGLGVAGRQVVERLRPAVVALDIRPVGDVFVDGVAKGTSPPLARLQLTPGKHVIEVRNPRFKTLAIEVEMKAGEEIAVRHSFTAPTDPKPRKRGFFDFLDRFK